MNNVFQVNQSTFGVTEDSSFKKRWTYRPKSQPSNSKAQRSVVTDNQAEDDWECLTGWDLAEWSHVDVSGTIEDTPDQLLFSVCVTCPSIFNYDEFKAASLSATSLSVHKVKAEHLRKGVYEAFQDDPRHNDVQGKNREKDNVEIESLQSAGTGNCTSQEVRAPEDVANIDVGEDRVSSNIGVGEDRVSSVKDQKIQQGRQCGEILENKCESKNQPLNRRSYLQSMSDTSIHQTCTVKSDRPMSCVTQTNTKAATGDGGKHRAFRKHSHKRLQSKKMILNPAPIEISYTEKGHCFEIVTMAMDDVNSEEPSDEKMTGNEENGERVNLRIHDKRAWEQSLKVHNTGFELPMLSDLSLGDLLTSSPRLQQVVDKTDSRLTYIQTLYDINPANNVVALENAPITESHVEERGFSNFPSLTASGSPQHLKISQVKNAPINCKESALCGGTTHRLSRHHSPPNMDGHHRLSRHHSPPNMDGHHHPPASHSSKSDFLEHRTLQQRGPPSFRPQTNKTPLQRAMENAHKRMYGKHHHLFSAQSAHSGQIESSLAPRDTRLRQTQSAHANKMTNAYMWKDRLDRNIKHQRAIYGPSCTDKHSHLYLAQQLSNKNQLIATVDWSKELAKQKKLQLKTAATADKYYTMSDFRAPLGTSNILRTQRGRVSQNAKS